MRPRLAGGISAVNKDTQPGLLAATATAPASLNNNNQSEIRKQGRYQPVADQAEVTTDTNYW